MTATATRGPTSGYELHRNGQPLRSMGNRTIYMTIEAAQRAQRRMRRRHGWSCTIEAWTA